MKRVCLVLRTCLLLFAVTLVIVSVPVVADHQRGSVRFELLETTIPAIHEAYANDVITPEQLVRMYLKRISAYDKAGPAFKGGSGMMPLNSYIHVNPRAVQDAHRNVGQRDSAQRRDPRGVRGQRHQRGPRRHDAMTEPLGDAVAIAGRPGTGIRLPAGREHHLACV